MSSGREGQAFVLTCFFMAGYSRHRKLGLGFHTAGFGRHRSQWVKTIYSSSLYSDLLLSSALDVASIGGRFK